MIYLRREATPVRNGINIFREFDRSIGFILRIGKFGWYVRWSRLSHRAFHELSFNMFNWWKTDPL